MRSFTPTRAAADGTRARLPGRTLLLLLGVALTGLASAFLLSPVSPFMQTDSTVDMAPAPRLQKPGSTAPLPDRPVTSRPSPEDGAADAGSTHSLAPRGNMSRIGVQPAADQPDFVPTPPPPAAAAPLAPMAPPAPAPVRAAPTSAAADDAAGDTTPRTAEDMVGAVRYYKLDQALQQVVKEEPATPVRVIVRTTPGMHASTAALLSEAGREVHSVHAQIEGLSATLSASDVAVLSEDPSIARMSIDAVVKATAEPTPGDVLRGALGLTPNGGVVSSDKKWKGRRVRVAIIDSGIEPTDDLKKNRVRYFYDFTNGGVRTAPYDDYGHGTHVAGLIGGRGRMSGDEYEGPAPRARFVGVKVLDGTGSGYTSDVLAGLEYVINNNQKLRVDVINLSLGHPIFEPAATDPLVQAVERAVAEGIVVVASAGNMGMNPETGEVGYAGISSPGNAPSAITVGSVDLNYTAHRADDAVGPYSSRGPTWYDAFASRTWRHRDINWRQLRRCKVRFTKSTQTCRWPGATGRRLGICD